MNNYQRGYYFERKIKKYLESKDFFVIRSGGSHCIADLVAIKKGKSPRVYLIQCKSGVGYMSPKDKDLLASVARETGAYGILAKPIEKIVKYIWIRGTKFEEKEIKF